MDIKGRPVEKIPMKSLKESVKIKAEETMKSKGQSLTWKGLIIALISAAMLYVLSFFVGEETATNIVNYLRPVLEWIFGLGVAASIWGIRRAIGGVQ